MTTQPATIPQRIHADDDWMLPDPPRKHDMLQHIQQVDGEAALKMHFEARLDVQVGAEGYIQRTRKDSVDRISPDIMVGFGVNPRLVNRRNGWVIDEAGKPPDIVFEIASESTGRRDYEVKPGIYARLGVPEMWLFDRTGGLFHLSALSGLRLVDGKYESIPIVVMEDGVHRGWSEVLQLYVCWVRGRLRFFDPVAQEYLPEPMEERRLRMAEVELREAAEVHAAHAEAEREAERHARLTERHARETAEAERETERRARETERNARLAAEARAAEAEAEVARIREQLSHRDG